MADIRLHLVDEAPEGPPPSPLDPANATDSTASMSSHHTEIKLRRLQERLNTQYRLHARASKYYEYLNLKFIGPAILISAFSSIASFLSTAGFMSTDARNYFGVCVGILTTISTMLQSISGSCSFNTKRDSFLGAADEYSKLITMVEFELAMPNEDKHAFFDRIETAILEIHAKCKFIPPLALVDACQSERNTNVTAPQTTAPHSMSRIPVLNE
jgi:hypothetical protein